RWGQCLSAWPGKAARQPSVLAGAAPARRSAAGRPSSPSTRSGFGYCNCECYCPRRSQIMGRIGRMMTLGLVAVGCYLASAAEPAVMENTGLFNGKDLAGWKLRNPKAKDKSKWSVVGAVRLKEGMPGRFEAGQGTGILLNGDDGRGVDLLSEMEHGDCELTVEFNVAKGSNSGIY